MTDLLNSLLPIILIAVTGFISVMALWVKFWLIELYKNYIRNLPGYIKNHILKYI